MDAAALLRSGSADIVANAILESIARADPRIAAGAALGLRVTGRTDRILELCLAAHRANASIAVVDAVLAEVVRLPDISEPQLRRMSDIVLQSVKGLAVPRGLGVYYYPGLAHAAGWSGLIAVAGGASAALQRPSLAAVGAAICAAGLIGGLLDLATWRLRNLWARPEISSKSSAELASLVVVGITLFLIRPYLPAAVPNEPWSGVLGMCLGCLPALLVADIMFKRGDLFYRWTARANYIGLIAACVAAGVGWYGTQPRTHMMPGRTWSFIFLTGAVLLAICVNIWSKGLVVRRRLGAIGDLTRTGLDLPGADGLEYHSPLDSEVAPILDAATAAMSARRFARAVALLSQVVDTPLAARLDRVDLCTVYVNRGLALWRSGQIRQALADNAAAAGLNLANANPHLNSGLILAQNGCPLDGLAEFDQALALAPINTDLLSSRAAASEMVGNLDRAEQDLILALELNPENSDALCNLGNVYAKRGLLDQATRQYERALEISPRDIEVRNNLALAWLRLGDPATARKILLQDARAIRLWNSRGRRLPTLPPG